MVIEQTINIPVDQQLKILHLELPIPGKHPSGRVRVAVTLTPESSSADNTPEPIMDSEIALNPPDFSEFCRLCEQAKQLNMPNFNTCEDILEEAAKRSNGMQALEYRRSAQRIRYWLNHKELWDESTRIAREIRDDWNDPWQAAQ